MPLTSSGQLSTPASSLTIGNGQLLLSSQNDEALAWNLASVSGTAVKTVSTPNQVNTIFYVP